MTRALNTLTALPSGLTQFASKTVMNAATAFLAFVSGLAGREAS